MLKKISFIKLIQVWVVIILVMIGGIIVAIDIITSYQDFHLKADKLRADYISKQKKMIKQEVMYVVNLIHDKIMKSDITTRTKIKTQVNVAHTIAQSIYQQNKDLKSRDEIQKMILDTLRNIRFQHGIGYYFVSNMDGIMMLHPFQTELEEKNNFNIKDLRGKYVIKDMINIIKQSGEGFYEYHWNKPGASGNDFRKISFVKLFKPYDWFIVTGLYQDDIQEQIKADLLSYISTIRFGKEGYIFINQFNGDALTSNGKLFSGTKKLWEVFNKYPEKIKNVFDKEYKAASKPDGDYIYYSWVKITSADRESPKTSFIYGIPDLQWLVGAGVYLDDVEAQILLMQAALNNQIREKILYSGLIIFGIVCFFLFLLSRLNRRLKIDFNLFSTFLNRVVQFNEKINRDKVQFIELDQMAVSANQMLKDKIQSKQDLLNEKEALRQSEEKFRNLVESSSDLIWEVDLEGAYTYISPQVEDILGYKQEELIGKVVFTLMLPEYAKHLAQVYQNIVKSGEPIPRVEATFAHKGGRHIILETSGSPIVATSGKIVGYRGVDRDITERKNTEEELQKMEQLKSIGTLAGGIAHDFNNILLGLYGNISLAKEEISKNSPAFESLAKAEKSMNRAMSLTNQLLTFAKGGVPVRTVIRLDVLIKEVVLFYLSGSNIKFHIELADDLWLAELDKGQIQQVFSNLTTNAKQAMPDGGNLYIQLENRDIKKSKVSGPGQGRYIQVIVKDDGAGIKKQYIDRIFDPYFTTKTTGTGLGLATTYSIINKHGGYIDVVSKPDKGATFTLYLPASKSQEYEEEVIEPIDIDKHKAVEQTIRILVMDDDKMICGLVKRMLTMAGFSVETVLDGEQAIKVYQESLTAGEPFDVIIMDLTVPGGMGGKDAVEEILLINPDAKVIVSSGYSNDPIMANYQEYGFIASIAKPFKKIDLIQVINSIL